MRSVEEIMNLSDDDLRKWALSGPENSYVHKIGSTEMNMRCALRIAKASSEMATAYGNLVTETKRVVEGHHGLIRMTKFLMIATWAIALTTGGLIVSELLRK